MKRRQFMLGLGAVFSAGCATPGAAAKARVVVIGGGYGGATAAKYLRLWSAGMVDVTLVEPNANFVSCPLSNLVLGGSKTLADITFSYAQLERRHGVRIVREMATALDPERRRILLASGQSLRYDRAIVSPGIDFMLDQVAGLAHAPNILHAWKAGPQTLALRQQLAAMPDGGVYAITIPKGPFRCPPGPYERACQVAHYFKRAKPKSKVLVLDGNDDVVSKGALFKKAWADLYPGIIEYRPNYELSGVDGTTARFEFSDEVKADVLNVIPPQRAGAIALQAGLNNANQRWCQVDFLSYESTAVRQVHVIGDAIQIAPGMSKSGHMANQHAKVCAAAVLDLLAGRAPNPAPMLNNTCYSFVSDRDAMHIASVHAYDAALKTMLTVPGSGGLSAAPSALEGSYGFGWANNIWADMLA